MSKFVNYKKRNIALPGKCKDLIEVLQPHGVSKAHSNIHSDVISGNQSPPVTHSETFSGRLSDLEKHIRLVFKSTARVFMVALAPANEQFTVAISRMNDGTIHASVEVQNESERERAVRAFFAESGLSIPEDSGMPSSFVPGIPVRAIYQIAPLPSEPSLLSKLVSDLLSTAFGLNDESALSFSCCEISDSA